MVLNMLALMAAVALAAATSGVQARPMHTAIVPHYERYLQEATDMEVELDAWLNKFKEQAGENGWIPPSEARSADDEKEDQRQRFFLTKERIKELETQNPDAKFSTDSPFTLLTDEEFNAYVGNAYRKAEDPVTRRLRGMHNGGPHGGGRRGQNRQRGRTTEGQAASVSDTTTSSDTVGSDSDKPAGWSFMDLSETRSDTTSTWSSAWDAAVINHSNINNNYKPATAAPYNPDTAAPAAEPVVAPEANSGGTGLTAAPQTDAPAADNTGYNFDTASNAPVAAEADTSAQAAAGKLDWSTGPCVSPIQNQGQCGSCWAFASTAAVESAQCIAGGQKSLVKYSEQQLASCDSKNYGCNGGAPVYAFDYIKTNGMCTEQAYPYASTNGRNAACTASCQKMDVGIKGSAKVSGEDGLLSTLGQHPVVVAVAAGNNAWKQYQGGVLSACDTAQVDHAVLAVGYDGDTIKIKNSWGATWGEQGYIRLKRGTPGVGTCGIFTDMSHPLV